MPTDVMRHLIQPLQKRFSWRENAEQEKAAKDDMIEAFSGYPQELLEKAAKEIRHKRKYQTMPTVGEIGEVIERLMGEAGSKWSTERRTSHLRQVHTYDDWTPEAIAAADKLIGDNLALSRRAAREGWALGYREYLRKERELPDERAIYQLQQDAKFVDRAAAGIFPEPLPSLQPQHHYGDRKPLPPGSKSVGHEMRKSLSKLAISMIARRNAIAQQIEEQLGRE